MKEYTGDFLTARMPNQAPKLQGEGGNFQKTS